MTIQEFAKLLDGRQYRDEITAKEEALAKKEGFVVVFGASDDLVEFRGAIDDEVGGPGVIEIDEDGPLGDCGCTCDCRKCEGATERETDVITAEWDTEGYSWVISADVPTATFNIMEDDQKYCRGIVFDIKSLG